MESGVLFVGAVFEEVGRLAVEFATDALEGTEANGAGFAGFEDGEVGRGETHAFGEFGKRYFPLGHHYV
jgi:hypothetical protein